MTARTTVLPGDRVVVRGNGVVLVADSPALGAPPAVTALIELLAGPDPDPMAALVGFTVGPSFVAVAADGDRARVLFGGSPGASLPAGGGAVGGPVTVALYDGAAAPEPSRVLTADDAGSPGAHRADAPGDRGPAELTLGPDSLVTVTVGPPPVPQHVCGPTALHLFDGAVPGRGAVLWNRAPEDPGTGTTADAEAATDALPTGDGDPTGERAMFDKTDLDLEAVTSPATGTGPLVPSVQCGFGHPNAPGSAFCRRCGALVDRRAPVLPAPRPPLGMLITDDGQTYVLATDVILGREPEGVVEQRGGRSFDGAGPLVALRLNDRTSVLSRVHVELRLDGWQVLAVDAGSANGTWLRAPGAAMPVRLPSGRPVPLPEGATLHIGGRSVLLAPLTSD